jgi:uncharacterized membrane protein
MSLQKSDYWIFGIIAVFAIVGLASAFVLSVEKLHLLQDPNATLSCSLNVWINCASVMKTWQASLFGFPNSFIGLMAYPVVITAAIVILFGARLPKIFWVLFQTGVTLGLLFAYWLFFQSVYVIQVLCPWCLLVTLSTTIIFATLTRYNILHGNLPLSDWLQRKFMKLVLKEYDIVLDAAWLVGMFILVFLQFRSYFAG